MLSSQKKKFFPLFSLLNFSFKKIHKHLDRKMNRDEQGGAGRKFEVLSEHTFWMTQSLFAAIEIYILIFNLTHSLISLMGSFHFPQWKIFFSIYWKILKILGNGISQSFILSLKCDRPLLCEFFILFLTVKLKLGHKFPQLIRRFNIGILKCWSGAVYISKFFPIHKKDGKLEFLKSLDCTSKFFPIHWKVWKLRFLSPLPSYLVKWQDWGWSLCTMTCGVKEEPVYIKLAVFKKKC